MNKNYESFINSITEILVSYNRRDYRQKKSLKCCICRQSVLGNLGAAGVFLEKLRAAGYPIQTNPMYTPAAPKDFTCCP